MSDDENVRGEGSAAQDERRRKARRSQRAADRDFEHGELLPDVPMIALRAGSGVVIHYTLPLHEAVWDQWRKGELHRVDGEGNPYEGDQYDLSDVDGYGDTAEDEAAEGDASGAGEDAGNEDRDGLVERTGGVNGRPGGVTEGVADGGISEPQRPRPDAPKKAWQDYAVAIGAVDADGAAGLTRQQLIDRSTPPELTPGAERP